MIGLLIVLALFIATTLVIIEAGRILDDLADEDDGPTILD